MGYNNIQDLVEHEKAKSKITGDKDECEEFDISLFYGRFPCIKVGESSFVELYKETGNSENILLSENFNSHTCSTGGKWTEPVNLTENWGSFTSLLPDFSSFSAIIGGSNKTLLGSEEEVPDGGLKTDDRNTTRKSLKAKTSNKSSFSKSVRSLPDMTSKKFTDVMGSTVKSLEANTSVEPYLDKPLRSFPGMTSKKFCQLENSGFYTVRKLLQHFPRTYADLQNAQDAINDGEYKMFVGKVLSSRGIKAGSSFSFLEVIVGCKVRKQVKENDDGISGENEMVYLHLKKFFRGTRFTSKPFLTNIQSKYNEGDHVYVSGKVRMMRNIGHFEIREYNIGMIEDDGQDTHVGRRPYPIYPSKSGLKPQFLGEMIQRALNSLTLDMDPLPYEVLKEFNLPNLTEAYFGIHRPTSLNEADLARRRLIFDDFFYIQLGKLYQMLDVLGTRKEKEQLLERYQNQSISSVSVEEWSTLAKRMLKSLPYSLTPSQQNAVSEIIWDLKRPVPMNRLLQGDVGCGKTVVAFLACMEVIGSGFQAAFMVPTEILAIQHYEHFLSLLDLIPGDECKPPVALLTGSTPLKMSRQILEGLQSGEIAMVIGTHCLISEKVVFSTLRIAVIDEQHRFGVIQRGKFNSKLYSTMSSFRSNWKGFNETSGEDKTYMAPHILAMSATPIPRTLALALHGDMSLTQITDMPPGRSPIETNVLEGNEVGFETVYQMMREDLITGGKVYLIYPIIEESEQLPQLHAAAPDLQSISEKLNEYQCGLIHGRMKSEEKEAALRKFRTGETQILLATQVIEVGVDVPDATMMVVMNAERFGLAQLHQLRGRVGRGERKSKCILLSSSSSALDRLKVLERSSDSFYLANADLLLRGPGNLLGKKQSGHLPEFPIARLEIDRSVLKDAHLAALKVLEMSNDLELFPKLKVELSMRQPLCILGD